MHEDLAPYREELLNKAVQAQYGAEQALRTTQNPHM
jgi:hypothetical protein